MKKILVLMAISLSTLLLNAQWQQIGQDINGDIGGDRIANAVCLSADGSIIAVGAELSCQTGTFRGHVRILENINGAWVQIGSKIYGEADNDYFGYSVSLSDDGSILAVGARGNDSNGDMAGHVRIFENINSEWVQIGSDIEGEAAGDLSGSSLSLCAEGNRVAIGATSNDCNGESTGHVRVYENKLGDWIQIGSDIDGELAGDLSGHSVSLSADGAIVAIGARANDANGYWSGQVRVYRFLDEEWVQVGSDIDGDTETTQLGWSVSLSAGGAILAAGAFESSIYSENSGHISVYEYADGDWAKIGNDIPGETENDYFGCSVSLSDDGTVLAAGSYRNDGNNIDAGHVRVYRNQDGNWAQIGSDIDGIGSGDWFGYSVSLSSDGSIVAGGAFNGNNCGDVGHARVFELLSTTNVIDMYDNEICTYPNPSKGQFIIDTTDFIEADIYNINGVLIKSTTKRDIDLSRQAKGIYFVKVKTNKGVQTQKLILE